VKYEYSKEFAMQTGFLFSSQHTAMEANQQRLLMGSQQIFKRMIFQSNEEIRLFTHWSCFL